MTERTFGGPRNVPESNTEKQRRIALSEVPQIAEDDLKDIDDLTPEEQQKAFGRSELTDNTDLVTTQDQSVEFSLPETDENPNDE